MGSTRCSSCPSDFQVSHGSDETGLIIVESTCLRVVAGQVRLRGTARTLVVVSVCSRRLSNQPSPNDVTAVSPQQAFSFPHRAAFSHRATWTLWDSIAPGIVISASDLSIYRSLPVCVKWGSVFYKTGRVSDFGRTERFTLGSWLRHWTFCRLTVPENTAHRKAF